jgi:hypothetical protein
MTRRHPDGGSPDTNPDRTGNLIVALVGTALTALVIFWGVVEVGRSLKESRIEETYKVTIKDGIRDGRFTVLGWGTERDCVAPDSDADFGRPLQCRTAVYETVHIPPAG